MRYLLLLLGLISTAYGQFQPTSAKTAFKNGISIGTRDSTAYTANDSLVVVINRQGRMMYRSTDGYWKILSNATASDYVPYTGAVTNVNLGNFRLTARSLRTDSIYSNSSAGMYLLTNGGAAVAHWGGGGSVEVDFKGFAGYDANRSASYTTRSFTDKGYVDSADALRVKYTDTAAMLAGYKTYYPRTAISLTTTGSSGAATYNNATGVLNIPQYAPDLSGYVPYTGATANVNLGAFDLTADVITGATGSFSSSGSSNTLDITHSSGSGIALNITKSGNGEGLYINKTSGSGNAATIIGTLNATTLVKSGGTSSQFLKADGSVDGNTYATTSALSGYLPLSGGTLTGPLNGTSAAFTGLTVNNGNAHLNVYLTTGTSAGWDIKTYLTGGNSGSEQFIYFGYPTAETNAFIQRGSNGRLDLGTSGTVRLSISSTGAATFSNTISGTSLSMSGGGSFGGNVELSGTTTGFYVNNAYPVARFSSFGYGGGSYRGVLIGGTSVNSLFFNVDVSGNPSGAFTGNGNEYVFRNVGSFITPNSTNNGYNTLFGWNTSGQINISGITSIGEVLIAGAVTDGTNKLIVNGGAKVESSGTATIKIKGNSVTTGFDLQNDIGGAYLWNRDATNMYFATNNTQRLSLNGTTGAATFSSSVSATEYRGSTASYSSAGTISANITTAFLTGNAYTINMPTATNGKVLIIIAETGLNTNGITLNGVNGGTYLLSCHHSLVLVGNGTTWKIASDYQNSAPCS